MKNNKVVVISALMIIALSGVSLASGGGEGHHVDSGVLLKDFLYRCLNFGLTFGLLAYFVTKPLKKGLAGRREGIEASLRDAREAKERAEANFAEYENKLARATEEIDAIYKEIRREGEIEREKILANAREMAEKIKSEASKTAESEIMRARTELRSEAARLAIEVAAEILEKNFSTEDQTRLVNEYMQKVGELH